MGRSGAAAAAAVEVESSGSASGRRADVTTGVYRPGPRRVRQTGIVSEVAPAVRSDPNPTVVVVGSINVDVVAQVERHPAPGETVLGDGGEVRCCGKGANQAVAAAYAGACVALLGAIGSARRPDHHRSGCRRDGPEGSRLPRRRGTQRSRHDGLR